MSTLRNLREHHKLTQQKLAELCNVPRRRICDYESGTRLFTDEQADSIERFFGVKDLILRPGHFFCEGPFRLSYTGRSFSVTEPTGLTLARCAHQFKTVKQFLKVAEDNLVPRYFPLDSGPEGLFWTHVRGVGAKLGFASPTLCGFDEHCLADGNKGLGLLKKPCAYCNSPDLQFLAWPQLTVSGPGYSYRLDALVLNVTKFGAHWSVHEVNGDGHRGDYDRVREEKLRLPVFYYTLEDLRNPKFGKQFLANLQSLDKKLLGVEAAVLNRSA